MESDEASEKILWSAITSDIISNILTDTQSIGEWEIIPDQIGIQTLQYNRCE